MRVDRRGKGIGKWSVKLIINRIFWMSGGMPPSPDGGRGARGEGLAGRGGPQPYPAMGYSFRTFVFTSLWIVSSGRWPRFSPSTRRELGHGEFGCG